MKLHTYKTDAAKTRTKYRLHEETCEFYTFSQLFQVCIPTCAHVILKLPLTSGCMCGSQVLKYCTLFETTTPVVYSYIHVHISPNTQTTTDIMMHTWFTSDAQLHTVQIHYPVVYSKCSPSCTQTTIDMKTMVHKWCWQFQFKTIGTYPLTHKTFKLL